MTSGTDSSSGTVTAGVRVDPPRSAATRTAPVRGGRMLAYRNRQIVGDGWIMVGDAAAFLDPIYSSGLFLALASAELAAGCVHEALVTGDCSAGRLGAFAKPLAQGIEAYRGETLTVLLPRQAGKNQVAAALVSMLLRANAARGGSIVVCAPTLTVTGPCAHLHFSVPPENDAEPFFTPPSTAGWIEMAMLPPDQSPYGDVLEAL